MLQIQSRTIVNKCDFWHPPPYIFLQTWPMYGGHPQYILVSGQHEFGDKSTNSCQGVSEAEKQSKRFHYYCRVNFVA